MLGSAPKAFLKTKSSKFRLAYMVVLNWRVGLVVAKCILGNLAVTSPHKSPLNVSLLNWIYHWTWLDADFWMEQSLGCDWWRLTGLQEDKYRKECRLNKGSSVYTFCLPLAVQHQMPKSGVWILFGGVALDKGLFFLLDIYLFLHFEFPWLWTAVLYARGEKTSKKPQNVECV